MYKYISRCFLSLRSHFFNGKVLDRDIATTGLKTFIWMSKLKQMVLKEINLDNFQMLLT